MLSVLSVPFLRGIDSISPNHLQPAHATEAAVHAPFQSLFRLRTQRIHWGSNAAGQGCVTEAGRAGPGAAPRRPWVEELGRLVQMQDTKSLLQMQVSVGRSSALLAVSLGSRTSGSIADSTIICRRRRPLVSSRLLVSGLASQHAISRSTLSGVPSAAAAGTLKGDLADSGRSSGGPSGRQPAPVSGVITNDEPGGC